MADHDNKCERLVLTAASPVCACWHRARIATLEADLAVMTKLYKESCEGHYAAGSSPSATRLTRLPDLPGDHGWLDSNPAIAAYNAAQMVAYGRKCAELAAAPVDATGGEEAVAWLPAAERFVKALIESDRLDHEDDQSDEAGVLYDLACIEYNESKRAMKEAYLAAPQPVASAPEPSAGVFRWIEDAVKLLKAVRASEAGGIGCHEVEGRNWFDAQDTLLSGVPCQQEDLGFGSPADKAASARPDQRDAERYRKARDGLRDLLRPTGPVMTFAEVDAYYDAALGLPVAARPEEKDMQEIDAQRSNLAALVRSMIYCLRKFDPKSDLAKRATAYLCAKGLQGSPLREDRPDMNSVPCK